MKHKQTRRRRKRGGARNREDVITQPIPETQLMFIGNGSYGSIYSLPEPYANLVIKEHSIQDQTFQTCDEWEQEYTIHTGIYNTCNDLLKQYNHTIVKPIQFGYAKHEDGLLTIQSTPTDASSCVILMERIFGRLPEPNPALEANLQNLLKPDANYTTKSYIPPYLFCGSFDGPQGAITLDMLSGVEMVPFVREELTYCHIHEPARSVCESMMLAFFTIVGKGFIPRDIEFVVSGIPHVTVLDFNECKTIEQRRRAAGDWYDINEDIANVYIDLCGLRKEAAAQNPQAPYEIGTPQWKFLCSPLASPYSFLEITERVRKTVCTLCEAIDDFDFDHIFQTILYYTFRNHFLPKLRTLGKRYKIQIPPFGKIFLYYHELYVKLSMTDTLIKRKVISETDVKPFYKQPYSQFLEQVKLLTQVNIPTQDSSFDVYSLWG
jgi:hypothetical protein